MLIWNGVKVTKKVIAATKAAVDETMAECVRAAKRLVPVDTSTLQGSIQMRPAKVVTDGIAGLWGSFTVNYAIYVETGTGKMAAQPYLRPAADQQYPLLAGRIKKRIAA